MKTTASLGYICLTTLLSTYAFATPVVIDGLTIDYQKLELPPEKLDSNAAAEITISNAYEKLYDLKTTLEPGCAHLPAISSIKVNTKTLPLLCGNNGAGRNETLQAIGVVSGNRAIATLGFGEMTAEVKVAGDNNYFLTAQRNPSVNGFLQYTVYKLTSDVSAISFSPSADEQALKIYRSTLANYQTVENVTDKIALETLQLISQVNISAIEQCAAVKSLYKKAKDGIGKNTTTEVLNQQTKICGAK
ncbi:MULTISPECIES: hypothetical protein [Pseudomonas syringae group]|uniref:hypothetical protein n=1 Tax=Pseudomonas syringae group TaxID=136849 RepID=UPI000AA2BBBD|nr:MULTISPECIES: hypothetical protein [Pseudomonas syringae group]MEE3917283.1 hypothetical protein [Pseudomonas viridiflava]MEE3976019.1 hypothetical protein [Pseudomonas viridiflava]MEE4021077.1 hypothetical protein [Pseudomonas viridiflava]MEE4048933.1 hypothetical protein [Pseudomonas viridiflava]